MRIRWEAIRREPFVLFVVIGILLYSTMRVSRRNAPVDSIVVRAETIRALLKQREELAGYALPPEEIRATVDGYIDDEVLLHEARFRGFDRNDYRVRKRLLMVMRSTLDEPVAEPSVAQLQAYYRENADRLRGAESISLEHVYFGWGSDKLPNKRESFVAALEASTEPASLGDYSPLGNSLPRQDRARLVMLFGPKFATDVWQLPVSEWIGPIESRAGVHYVRLLERHPAELAPFEQIEKYLRQEWMFKAQRKIQQDKVEKLRERYRIVVPEEFRPPDESP